MYGCGDDSVGKNAGCASTREPEFESPERTQQAYEAIVPGTQVLEGNLQAHQASRNSDFLLQPGALSQGHKEW